MPLITITGASGVGKTTIMRHIMREDPRVMPLKSTTTRKPRGDDIDGEYEYLTERAFKALDQANAFLWTVSLHGNHYGTRKKIIRASLLPDFKVIALIVHEAVISLRAFAREHGVEDQIRSAYILSPGRDILMERLERRLEHSRQVALRRLEECTQWDTEAKASAVPYRFIQDDNDIERKVRLVKSLF